MLAVFLSLIDDDRDREKFEKLYEKYRWLMFSVALRILGNRQDAEDATQEAFFRIAGVMNRVGAVDSSQTKNFVALITRNVCLDLRKKEKARAESVRALAHGEPEPVLHFVVETYDKFTGILFDRGTTDAAPDGADFALRKPHYVPEGFTLADTSATDASCMETYKNRVGDTFVYTQDVNDGMYLTINTEHRSYETIQIQSQEAIYYEDDGMRGVVFCDGDLVFTVSGSLPRETILQIAESIQ